MRINDVIEKLVLQEEKDIKQNSVEKLVAGLYILEVYSGNNKIQTKFVKK